MMEVKNLLLLRLLSSMILKTIVWLLNVSYTLSELIRSIKVIALQDSARYISNMQVISKQENGLLKETSDMAEAPYTCLHQILEIIDT